MNGQPNPTDVEIMSREEDYWQGLREALDRLEANPDFQKVILDAYFKDFAVNQTSMLASSRVAEGGRSGILERLVAIAQLQDYLITVKQLGASPDDEDVLEEYDEDGED